MNNKGFTLIELIGSIIILTIIALVAFPAILNVMTTSQNEIDNAKKQLAERAAKEYVEDNVNLYPREAGAASKTIKVQDLVAQGYIKEKSIDSVKDSAIYNGCIEVSIATEQGYTSYQFKFTPNC